jgi:kynurenine formamidase
MHASARTDARELVRIDHDLQPLEIVLINTRAGKRYAQDDYVSSGCGMGYDATMYLLERGVRVTGMDGWSWDAPFVHTKERYEETHDARLIWEGHKANDALMRSLFRSESLPVKCKGACLE